MKRPRISLLTALLTMLAAAGLLALNVIPRTEHAPSFMATASQTGWPWVLTQSVRLGDTELGDISIELPSMRYERRPPFELAVAGNLATALVLLTLFAFVCETLLRRRDPSP